MNTTTTSNRHVHAALDCRPDGTTALAVAPWARDEVYGVAARWADAAAPVWVYGPDRWTQSAYQAADYRHSASAALAAEIAQAIVACGGEADDAEIDPIVRLAVVG